MPAILDRCVMHVMARVMTKSSAFAICRSSLDLKEDGTDDMKEMEDVGYRAGGEDLCRLPDESGVDAEDHPGRRCLWWTTRRTEGSPKGCY